MNTFHFIGLVLLGIIAFLYGGLWLLGIIERAWNMRKRDRLK